MKRIFFRGDQKKTPGSRGRVGPWNVYMCVYMYVEFRINLFIKFGQEHRIKKLKNKIRLTKDIDGARHGPGIKRIL